VASAEKALEKAQKEKTAKADELAKLAEPNHGNPVGTYSLARVQVALWATLVVAGFCFIWLVLGQYNGLVTNSILALLGISGLTTLASLQVNQVTRTDLLATTSDGFFNDIFNDGGGPTVHRIQAVVWTIVLAGVFMWNVAWNFSFVEFSETLLILLGISNFMYIGLKYSEARS
jgi:hypothetical protein